VYYLEGRHVSIDTDVEMQVNVAVWRCQSQINWHSLRINTDSASTPLYFVTFIISVISMTSKITFLYIWASVLALHLSALTMLSEEKQKSAATFYTELSISYFISTTDHQSPQIMDNGIDRLPLRADWIHNNVMQFHSRPSSYSTSFWQSARTLFGILCLLFCNMYENVLLRWMQNKLVTKPGMSFWTQKNPRFGGCSWRDRMQFPWEKFMGMCNVLTYYSQ